MAKCKYCGRDGGFTNLETIGVATVATGIGVLLLYLPEWLF